MGIVVVLALFSVGIFLALLFMQVESWKPRVILFLLAAAAWYFFGLIGVMITTAIFSVGIIIGSQIPKVSKL